MRNSLFLRLSRVWVALVMIAGMSSFTSADEQSLQFQTQDHVKVTGTASFAHHHTLIPLNLCEGAQCPRSRSYWTLVVHSGPSHYDLDQVFAMGSDSQPESLQIGEAVIRPGSHLTMEARLEVVSRNSATLSDVRNIRVVKDQEAWAAPFFGWTCRSIGENRMVYVDIAQVSHEGAYSMRILASSEDAAEPALRTVAAFSDVQLNMNSDAIDFSGATPRVAAELSIDQRAGRASDLESLLHIKNTSQSADLRIPLETVVKLSCNRTR